MSDSADLWFVGLSLSVGLFAISHALGRRNVFGVPATGFWDRIFAAAMAACALLRAFGPPVSFTAPLFTHSEMLILPTLLLIALAIKILEIRR